MTAPTTVQEVLEGALTKLETVGWIQGASVRFDNDRSPDAKPIGFCLIGALSQSHVSNHDVSPLYFAAADRVIKTIWVMDPAYHGTLSIPVWNDAEGREQEQVLDVLRRAIKDEIEDPTDHKDYQSLQRQGVVSMAWKSYEHPQPLMVSKSYYDEIKQFIADSQMAFYVSEDESYERFMAKNPPMTDLPRDRKGRYIAGGYQKLATLAKSIAGKTYQYVSPTTEMKDASL